MTAQEIKWFRERPPTCLCYTEVKKELGVLVKTYHPMSLRIVPFPQYFCVKCGLTCNLKGAKAKLHLITPKSKDGKTVKLHKQHAKNQTSHERAK